MFGKRLNVANEFKEKMIEVGFEDVVDEIIKVRFSLTVELVRIADA